MKIAIAQVNPTVGDLDGNADTLLSFAQRAAGEGASLVAFGDGALTGVPLGGLARSAAFLADALAHLRRLADELPVLALVPCVFDAAGYAYADEGPDYAEATGQADTPVTTGLFIVGDGDVQLLYAPSFEVEGACPIVQVAGEMVAVLLGKHYNVSVKLEGAKAMLELCADAYTEEHAAPAARSKITRYLQLVRMCNAHVGYVNLCGASDATVFAGNSLVAAPDGRLLRAAALDAEDLIVFDTANRKGTGGAAGKARVSASEIIWRGIVTATRDYVAKNGFSDVLVGISGGIDSALVTTLAVDALGPEHVHGLLMPGPYSSDGSLTDAAELAANLGIDATTVPITDVRESMHAVLGEACGGAVEGVAAENLQARIRAVYLMTVSNARGWLVLNTGNKSEAAMGFSTLGGDTCGVFAPLGNMYKSDCYELAKWRVGQGASIPQACIDKAPSAELYPGATDQDRLPPYEQLDEVLLAHVEDGKSAAEIVALGYDAQLVDDVLGGLVASEFKRRLEPLAPLVMGRAFTDGRAWPITNGWRDLSARDM